MHFSKFKEIYGEVLFADEELIKASEAKAAEEATTEESTETTTEASTEESTAEVEDIVTFEVREGLDDFYFEFK